MVRTDFFDLWLMRFFHHTMFPLTPGKFWCFCFDVHIFSWLWVSHMYFSLPETSSSLLFTCQFLLTLKISAQNLFLCWGSHPTYPLNNCFHLSWCWHFTPVCFHCETEILLNKREYVFCSLCCFRGEFKVFMNSSNLSKTQTPNSVFHVIPATKIFPYLFQPLRCITDSHFIAIFGHITKNLKGIFMIWKLMNGWMMYSLVFLCLRKRLICTYSNNTTKACT